MQPCRGQGAMGEAGWRREVGGPCKGVQAGNTLGRGPNIARRGTMEQMSDRLNDERLPC